MKVHIPVIFINEQGILRLSYYLHWFLDK